MKILLWLDDLRDPFLNLEGRVPSGDWEICWVLNYKQFVDYFTIMGLPDAISFDHDLAREHYTPEVFWKDYQKSKKYQKWKSKFYKEKTGEDCAKWLVEYCTNTNQALPEIYVHSANPVGADNIKAVLRGQNNL